LKSGGQFCIRHSARQNLRSCSPRPGTLPLTILAICALQIIAAAAQLGVSTNNQPTSIRGTVINSVTREPVGRALVYSQDKRLGTLTDAQGHFEFTIPKATKQQDSGSISPSGGQVFSRINVNTFSSLLARKPGFLEETQRSRVQIGPGDELTIPLVPESSIVGRVILPTAEPAEQVQVQLYQHKVDQGRADWVLRGNLAARSSGDFRFADLSAGTYKLLTSEYIDRDPLNSAGSGEFYGYPPVYYPSASNFANASLIRLSAGETIHADINLKRQLYHPVRIVLSGIPSESGVNVSVSKEGQVGPGFSLAYSPDVGAIMGSLPDGAYQVEGFSYPPVPASGVVNITVKGAAIQASMVMVPNRSIRVNVAQEFTSSDDSAKPEFVSGRVRLQLSNNYVNVSLEPLNDFTSRQAVMARVPNSKETGMVLENVQPGSYRVRLDSARGYVASATSGGVDLLRHPLVVGFGNSNSPIEITLHDDTAEISGTIEGIGGPANKGDNSETPASQSSVQTWLRANSPFSIQVYCIPLPDSTGQFKQGWASPDGTFTLPQLAPGAYRILAFDSAPEGLEYDNPDAMAAYDSKGQVVSLTPGQKERLKLHMIANEP